MRDGEPRWLAKQMAKGIMPEEQRENRLNGRWDADWHLRIGRRRKEYLTELERLESDQRFSAMFDVPLAEPKPSKRMPEPLELAAVVALVRVLFEMVALLIVPA